MFALIVLVEWLSEPARPMLAAAAATSSFFRIGNDLPLPAKSLLPAAARSVLLTKRSHNGIAPLV
jgi:hypothetical protein